MSNKLVVIIHRLKVPNIKKLLLYEMKLLVPNYSCLQSPWLGGYRPQIPVLSVLFPQLNLLYPPPPPNKIPGYSTEMHQPTCPIRLSEIVKFSRNVTYRGSWVQTRSNRFDISKYQSFCNSFVNLNFVWYKFSTYHRIGQRPSNKINIKGSNHLCSV